MANCLLCPNQALEFGTVVDHVPEALDHTEEEWDPYDENVRINAVNSGTTVVEEQIYEYYEPHSEHLQERFQRSISSAMTKSKSKLTPEYLTSIWGCGKETAKKTIEATTCKHYRRTLSSKR